MKLKQFKRGKFVRHYWTGQRFKVTWTGKKHIILKSAPEILSIKVFSGGAHVYTKSI